MHPSSDEDVNKPESNGNHWMFAMLLECATFRGISEEICSHGRPGRVCRFIEPLALADKRLIASNKHSAEIVQTKRTIRTQRPHRGRSRQTSGGMQLSAEIVLFCATENRAKSVGGAERRAKKGVQSLGAKQTETLKIS